MTSGDRSTGGFGARMRQAREARGVSLRQIAEKTKLSMRALEGLERDDISLLPGGIFSRAFIRSYAQEIGMDPERTVRDFIAQFPHDSVTIGTVHEPPDLDVRPRGRGWLALLIVLLVAVAAAVAFTLR